ncbi:hypothetical protein CEXT_438051 [Caerostris extrusa]|uniref:Methyltransferase type 11 domain-containing protein n=1 Tax=Caerostris extrusa TaxID=172846 RepID=A0AAV4U174_CAEEX|nr:hypothetical protein CEXT_438051 [Caerostris extrusa]
MSFCSFKCVIQGDYTIVMRLSCSGFPSKLKLSLDYNSVTKTILSCRKGCPHGAINPTEYSKNQLHLKSIQDFLLDVADKANIRTTAKQVVLDVGCGPGMGTKELMLPLIQERLEKMFAFDVSPVMIEIANQKYSDKKY